MNYLLGFTPYIEGTQSVIGEPGEWRGSMEARTSRLLIDMGRVAFRCFGEGTLFSGLGRPGTELAE